MHKKTQTDELDSLKKKLKQQWHELTHDDLAKIKTVSQQVTDILEKKYHYDSEQVKKQIDKLCYPNITEHATHEVHELKQTISDLTDEVIGHLTGVKDIIPDLAQEGEEKIVNSIKSHPLSSLGLVAAAGFILGSLLTRK